MLSWYFLGTRPDGCVTMKGKFPSAEAIDEFLKRTAQENKYTDVRKFAVTKEGQIMFTKKGKDKPDY